MASADHQYPVYLNPFGDDLGNDDEPSDQHQKQSKPSTNPKSDDYPEYLSPFEEEEDNTGTEPRGPSVTVDDYDDSLNPFGDDEEHKQSEQSINHGTEKGQTPGDGNPFEDGEEDEDVEHKEEVATIVTQPQPQLQPPPTTDYTSSVSPKPAFTPQPESLEPPPIPLPRTKSLLKKEQALKNRQLQQLANDSNQTNSLLSKTSSNSSSSIATTTTTTANSTTADSTTAATTGSFQRKKNKRNAPPVPINFKRQVSGSLDAIEQELNEIGDTLAIIEKESNLCQESLKATHQVDDEEFAAARSKFVELIKRKNSIVRRQKELMYQKRELKLDQIHSDIEYELRMIGNKQLSHRTAEDEIREKELLKKLVEIVEEKSDIVENLNKDTSCDSHDIGEALRRLNITNDPPDHLSDATKVEGVKNSPQILTKNESCDRSTLAMGVKLSKIATLLPKSGTIKGTMKIKRKRLFKKSDSRPIER